MKGDKLTWKNFKFINYMIHILKYGTRLKTTLGKRFFVLNFYRSTNITFKSNYLLSN